MQDILAEYDSPLPHWSNEPEDEGDTPPNDVAGHNPSSVHFDNEPSVGNDTPLDNDNVSDYSSSVYSEVEIEGVSRRVYRVSSDDSSSLYSNNEPGVAGSTNPFTEESAHRHVSPLQGFNDSSAEDTEGDHLSTPGHNDEPELPRAPTAAQYYSSAPIPQHPDWIAAPSRPRVSTPTPTPVPAYITFPQQTDWTPVLPRLSAALLPDRTAPATPLPPAIPPRKRPCLTGEEMFAIVKQADAVLETRQLSTGNIGGQAIQASTQPHAELINENFQLAANKRRRNIAPDRATYRIMSMDQETEAAQQSLPSSFKSDSLSSPASQLIPGDAHNASTQRVPTPSGFPNPASASRESLADSDVSIWHPAPIQVPTWNRSAVFGPAQTIEKQASTTMQDREDMTQASERLREMGSGYSPQRTAYRPSKSADMSNEFCPGIVAMDSASGNGFVRADHPSYQDASRNPPPKPSFKEKMRSLKKGTAKITDILKLRKSSKEIQKENKTPEDSLDMTLVDSGRKTPGLLKKVRSIPSLSRLRQRSHVNIRKATQNGDVPPVPVIPLRHRKTSAQVAGERGL